MLEKKVTIKQIFQFIMLVVMFIFLVAANVDAGKKRKTSKAQIEIARYDSINKKVAELEAELKLIMEDNRLCAIIGAYTIINQPTTKPTQDNVEALVLLCNCWYPDIIMAQYQIESAKGTSYIAKHNNNLFGMRKAWTRKSVRCKAFDRNGYAVYNNWQLSVIDRIYWEEHAFPCGKPSRMAYLNMIRKIYAEDTNYIAKLLSVAKEYEYLYD